MPRRLGVFVVEQFGYASKENTSDRTDKLSNLKPVGNTESLEVQLTQVYQLIL